MRNKKGFTLIELLAAIVILAIILAIAIPSVTQYISDSRKDSYVATAKEFADTVTKNATGDQYEMPINSGDVTIVSLNMVDIQKGGTKSPYSGKWINDSSYVVILNTGTALDPKYEYYVAVTDSKRYTIPLTHQNDVKSSSIVRNTVAKTKASVTPICGNEDGAYMVINNIAGLESKRPSNGWSAYVYSKNNCQ